MDQTKAAYILLRFPCFTETFVAEEMQKIQSAGVQIRPYSLLTPRDSLVHPVSQSLLPLVRYAPGLHHPALWLAQLYYWFKSPGVYFRSLWKLLTLSAPLFSFRMKRLVVFLKAAWIAKDLENQQIGLVHTHFAWLSAGAGWVISRLLDVPFTITTHAYDIYSIKNDLLPFTAAEAARVITISEENRRAMLKLAPGLPPEKISVIHCGIDLTFFQPDGSDHLAVEQPLRITSVGSLIEKKGHEVLIRACAVLKERGVDFACTIVGGGNLHDDLAALIHGLDLADRVSLAGTQPQPWVKQRLSQSDIFVLSCVSAGGSDRDGIPVVLMEALAMGVPVISTPVSGIPELIRHEETGLLTPERDATRLADAILRLAEDGVLRQKLITGGRALIEREFDIAGNVVHLSAIFREAAQERG